LARRHADEISKHGREVCLALKSDPKRDVDNLLVSLEHAAFEASSPYG
jgi:hypothetical protein